jgi:hypothetical protein
MPGLKHPANWRHDKRRSPWRRSRHPARPAVWCMVRSRWTFAAALRTRGQDPWMPWPARPVRCCCLRSGLHTHVSIVDSSFSGETAIPCWWFGLPDEEYQGCSPADSAAGFTTACNGRFVSINIRVIGGTPMVQLHRSCRREALRSRIRVRPLYSHGPREDSCDARARRFGNCPAKDLRMIMSKNHLSRRGRLCLQ